MNLRFPACTSLKVMCSCPTLDNRFLCCKGLDSMVLLFLANSPVSTILQIPYMAAAIIVCLTAWTQTRKVQRSVVVVLQSCYLEPWRIGDLKVVDMCACQPMNPGVQIGFFPSSVLHFLGHFLLYPIPNTIGALSLSKKCNTLYFKLNWP